MVHEKERLGQWMQTVPPPPAVDSHAAEPKELGMARKAVEKAIKGMLPHNSLGRQQMTKLKVYAGAEHPHAAQKPVPFEISQVAQ